MEAAHRDMPSLKVMLPHYNPKNPWAKDEGGCSSLTGCERCGTKIRIAARPCRNHSKWFHCEMLLLKRLKDAAFSSLCAPLCSGTESTKERFASQAMLDSSRSLTRRRGAHSCSLRLNGLQTTNRDLLRANLKVFQGVAIWHMVPALDLCGYMLAVRIRRILAGAVWETFVSKSRWRR